MKRTIHFYAVETINNKETLHRFPTKSERDGWVSGDTRHREVVIREDAMLGRNHVEWRDAFIHQDELPWTSVEGHDVVWTSEMDLTGMEEMDMGTEEIEITDEKKVSSVDVGEVEMKLSVHADVLAEIINYLTDNDGRLTDVRYDFVIFMLDSLKDKTSELACEVGRIHKRMVA